MVENYLVLDSDPADDGLRWRLDRALAALLPDLELTYRYRDGADGPLVTDVWEAAGTRAVVSLVADHHTPSHYVMVEATDDELAGRVTRELKSVLPVLSLEELQARAERGDDPSALVRLAQGADPVHLDDRSAALISAGFDDAEPLVRYRAAEAAGLAPRAEFLHKLEDLAQADPDGSVRAMSEAAANACRPSGS